MKYYTEKKNTNGKIQQLFMTCCRTLRAHTNVSVENYNKSRTTLLSQSLIQLKEVFDKQNTFGKSSVDQTVKMTYV